LKLVTSCILSIPDPIRGSRHICPGGTGPRGALARAGLRLAVVFGARRVRARTGWLAWRGGLACGAPPPPKHSSLAHCSTPARRALAPPLPLPPKNTPGPQRQRPGRGPHRRRHRRRAQAAHLQRRPQGARSAAKPQTARGRPPGRTCAAPSRAHRCAPPRPTAAHGFDRPLAYREPPPPPLSKRRNSLLTFAVNVCQPNNAPRVLTLPTRTRWRRWCRTSSRSSPRRASPPRPSVRVPAPPCATPRRVRPFHGLARGLPSP
jgi:hypothetical protein